MKTTPQSPSTSDEAGPKTPPELPSTPDKRDVESFDELWSEFITYPSTPEPSFGLSLSEPSLSDDGICVQPALLHSLAPAGDHKPTKSGLVHCVGGDLRTQPQQVIDLTSDTEQTDDVKLSPIDGLPFGLRDVKVPQTLSMGAKADDDPANDLFLDQSKDPFEGILTSVDSMKEKQDQDQASGTGLAMAGQSSEARPDPEDGKLWTKIEVMARKPQRSPKNSRHSQALRKTSRDVSESTARLAKASHASPTSSTESLTALVGTEKTPSPDPAACSFSRRRVRIVLKCRTGKRARASGEEAGSVDDEQEANKKRPRIVLRR